LYLLIIGRNELVEDEDNDDRDEEDGEEDVDEKACDD
jgi:hypothetical protein